MFSKSDRVFISTAMRFHGRLGQRFKSDNNAKIENFPSLSLFRGSGGGDMNAATTVSRPQKRLIIGRTAGRRVKLFTSIAHRRRFKIIIFPPRNNIIIIRVRSTKSRRFGYTE